MPCALVENADYPDYLKAILKEIEAGNDDRLKTCACRLKTPLTDEGCPILDEDQKIGGFPFCWTLSSPGDVGKETRNPVKLTLKQAMWLYWQSKSFESKGSYTESGNGAYPICKSMNYKYDAVKLRKNNIENGLEYKGDKKQLVCAHTLSFDYSVNVTRGNPICPPNASIVTLAYAFGTNNKYVKEGNTYYFYPEFRAGNTGGYDGNTDTLNLFGLCDDCFVGDVHLTCSVSGENSSEISILGESIAYSVFYCTDGDESPPTMFRIKINT